jgi:hypothetical protein
MLLVNRSLDLWKRMLVKCPITIEFSDMFNDVVTGPGLTYYARKIVCV